MPTSLREPLMGRRIYSVHLGVRSQSATHPTKRRYKARTTDKLSVSTSVPESNLNIKVSPGETPVSLHKALVSITPEAINSLYWAEPIQPNSTFRRKVDDKENQFQWVANIIAMGQPQWTISKGMIHHRDLKFEAYQNKRRAKQQITSLPYPSVMSMLCVRVSCPLLCPLDKTVRADGWITLASKTDRDAPVMNKTSRKPIQPARDKLKVLCTKIEVLENEVITLRKDVATLTRPPTASNPTPPEPTTVTL
ncbi:hypothetical protein HAX54_049344 [Datura stramonium]|uniref:Uncharacterized protein n=1 Tax=Datura stramonium TaxID=4076 RepID=A0ABS8SUS1_DATST|nr:hypothetical protein [Datura stramonium]